MTGRFERVAAVAVMCVVVAVAATITRDFARYTDHYPYLALDDALGNVSYNLASRGVYGFPTSPVQGAGTTRNTGFFNYGPWYFYAGAGLIWMFGYSIGLLRSLHLLGILAIAASACWWFGRRRQLAAGALIALGLFYCFDVAQWPMVRPDIAVSVFAVMMIVAAGLAIENGSPAAWGGAGLAAGCAAFTHLIAWALVPCCVFILVIALVNEWPGKRRALVALLAVAIGGVAAAAMFYASFGFRVRDQLSLLQGYGAFLSGAAAGDVPSPLVQHLQMGFLYLSAPARTALAGATLASVGLLIASARWPRPSRTAALAILLPPVAVLSFYLASLTRYANFHLGYVILLQVAAWWCAGALACALLQLIERRRPVWSRLIGTGTALVVLVAGAMQLTTRVRTDSNPRLAFVRQWVGIQDYIDNIGGTITRGASVWGAPIFGIDSPDRFDLVDADSALSLVERARLVRELDMPRIAPAYLAWGYGDNRDNTIQSLYSDSSESDFVRMREALLPVDYRLTGLIEGPPYGVTRVYRAVSTPEAERQNHPPAVSAYNSATERWDRYLDGPVTVALMSAEPVLFDLRYGTIRQPVRADRTVMTELPEGRYLLRVRLVGSATGGRTVVAATSAHSISEDLNDLGPSIDFSPYVQGDTDTFLIHTHPGGTLYVSQFDKSETAALQGLDVYRILPAPGGEPPADRQVFSDMPVEPWLAFVSPGVRGSLTATDTIAVQGDATGGGFQISSPLREAAPKSTVTIRAGFVAQEGHVCVGALSRKGTWLANGGDPMNDFTFTVDATAGFRVVFYNCNPGDTGNEPSRFTVSGIRYAVREPGTYVDRLLAALNPAATSTAAANLARPRATGLTTTSGEAGRIQIPVRTVDLRFRAPIVKDAGDGWLILGRAESRYSYALRFAPTKVTEHRLVVSGVVKRGGITVGLLRNGLWAASVNVSVPGPFAVVVDPPELGAVYDILVAHNIGDDSLMTDVTLEHIGWAPIAAR
jgi:hypothetical protein